ncbi:hypothetical protein PFISCL1PPCAC_11573, partial [Pristionchus fissidentatus]
SSEMRCVLCDNYGTHSVSGYAAHLKKKHQTTATEAGIIFRCACGNESRAEAHFSKCHGASVTIVRDSMNDEGECAMEQPQMSRNSENNVGNVTGEQRYGTHSVTGYMIHLIRKHQTNAKEAGVIFRCACGGESHHDRHFRSNK